MVTPPPLALLRTHMIQMLIIRYLDWVGVGYAFKLVLTPGECLDYSLHDLGGGFASFSEMEYIELVLPGNKDFIATNLKM